jgi:hypothetical protein
MKTRFFLAASVLLNLALLGKVFWLNHQTVELAAQAELPVRAAAETSKQPFQWSRLASLEPSIYVPEPAEVAGESPAQDPSIRTRRPEVQDTSATMPLVFKPVDTNLVKLTAEDMQTVDRVRQSFLAELGTDQDVNSPEYLRRWQKAQQQADNLLDAMLGRQAVLQYEWATDQAVASGAPAAN